MLPFALLWKRIKKLGGFTADGHIRKDVQFGWDARTGEGYIRANPRRDSTSTLQDTRVEVEAVDQPCKPTGLIPDSTLQDTRVVNPVGDEKSTLQAYRAILYLFRR